ncbi:MAG: anti-sigma factor antagonist [Spartobacteria bacterium]|nr:anti-sigma factor antagonist [Spartobacteria bacterium]
MSVEITRKDRVGIVSISDAMTAATAEAFRDTFVTWQHNEPEVKNFVFDMSRVGILDSAGLGTLMGALTKVSRRGGDIKIAGLQEKPRLVFDISRAFKIFETFDTVEEALDAIR